MRRDWLATLTARADAVAYGAAIHRHVAPTEWPNALQRVPAEKRPGAETYLRGIAARMRAQRSVRRAMA